MTKDIPDMAANDNTDDNKIKHASYSIRRPGARMSLNDNDSEFDQDRTELTVMPATDDIGSPEGILLQATFDNGGMLEAYTGLTLTPDQAWDLSIKIQLAVMEYRRQQ